MADRSKKGSSTSDEGDDYSRKRDRNNQSVKKSREKTRRREKEVEETHKSKRQKLEKLEQENATYRKQNDSMLELIANSMPNVTKEELVEVLSLAHNIGDTVDEAVDFIISKLPVDGLRTGGKVQ